MEQQKEKLQSTKELKNYSPNSTKLVKRFGTADTFTDVCEVFFRQVVHKGSQECFFGNYPTLTEINIAYHKNMATSMLMSQINDLSEYCGCKGKVSDRQSEQCAEIIVLNYPYLKISELALFFAWFKAAKYGQFYGSVDPLVITSALRTFVNHDRNDAYFKHESILNEQKQEEAKKNCISWEEYCKRKEIKGKQSPLNRNKHE